MRRRSNVAPSILGIFLGLLTCGLAVGVASFLFFQQLSRSPVKPAFAEAKKDTSKLDLRGAENKAYLAQVVYQQDLLLREAPSASGKVVDKLKFEETITVLAESDDGQWQQVRSDSKGIEGWIQAGNIKRAQ